MKTSSVGTTQAEFPRHAMVQRGLMLECVSVGYNCLEALVAMIAGLMAGSIALVGFGFDSIIEVTSSLALLWRLRADFDRERRRHAELLSLRIVGLCFVGLALYIAYEAIERLWQHQAPERSVPGMVLAVLSLVIMPFLARAKRRIAIGINSDALRADARQTEFCVYLSAILLGGLLLNVLWGWWWADPLSALVMAPIIAREGAAALRGRPCGCAVSTLPDVQKLR